MPKVKTIIFIQLANYIPLLGILGLTFSLVTVSMSWTQRILLAAGWVYLLPPLIYRIWMRLRKKKEGLMDIDSPEYYTWWVGVQLQALYIRFPSIEELLRVIPMAYSLWLRLWGSKIGKAVYWSPQTLIMDRGYMDIGDFVVIGVGAKFTSHHVSAAKNGRYELLLRTPRVGSFSILGGCSGLGPGAFVEEKQMLPSHLLLAPGYGWTEKGRKAPARADA